ncbi:hypothetical protein B0H14DRAFT_2579263 [Mycena olivaceomarginata]|nr:hypothetical protein B0H14DRAFT_2579263 [Mycena olivaceomarginata]
MPSVKESLQDRLKTAHTASNKGKENNLQPKKPSKEKQPKETTKKTCHYLTDQLLTLIEGSQLYRQSFGFVKSAPGSVPTGGKKPADLHAEIAQTLFIMLEAPADPMFEAEDLGTLTTAMGSRLGLNHSGLNRGLSQFKPDGLNWFKPDGLSRFKPDGLNWFKPDGLSRFKPMMV